VTVRPLFRASQNSATQEPRTGARAPLSRATGTLVEERRHAAFATPSSFSSVAASSAACPSSSTASPSLGWGSFAAAVADEEAGSLPLVAAEADALLDRAELSLTRRIRAHLPRGSLSVTLTDNRHTMISVRRDHSRGPRYRVRLHHMFADADSIVTRALARYIGQNDPSASRVLGAFIDSHQHRVRPVGRVRQLVTIETRGRHFDLQEIFDDLNRRYFDGAIQARITWGQRCGKPRRRNSIKMGSYSVEEKLIRVHRSLDRGFVPRYFVEWIVYHEMLHQVHQAMLVNGRRQFHTPAFLVDEARYEHYERARSWERANLDEILTY
jgi:hypothetical protein